VRDDQVDPVADDRQAPPETRDRAGQRPEIEAARSD
jgi:hypothetical protein